MENNIKLFINDKSWIETVGAVGVFENKITDWIEDFKNGSLTKEDILTVTKKVAEYRRTPDLVTKIKNTLGTDIPS
ncbi:MAG: hypothetical protein KAR54_02330 [Candidatus Pacebacteria bacterium]|nr:hypothetical protein [Candidatus Paceibacterota bacterium]